MSWGNRQGTAFTAGNNAGENSLAASSAASCDRTSGSCPCRRCTVPWSSGDRRPSARPRTRPESATVAGCPRRCGRSWCCSSCWNQDTRRTLRRAPCLLKSPCRCSSSPRFRCCRLKQIETESYRLRQSRVRLLPLLSVVVPRPDDMFCSNLTSVFLFSSSCALSALSLSSELPLINVEYLLEYLPSFSPSCIVWKRAGA